MNIKKVIILGILILYVGISFNQTSTSIIEKSYFNAQYAFIDPFYINVNDSFTSINGNTCSSDTKNDPYITDEWEISGPSYGQSGINYTFCIDVIDPEGDFFYCIWYWGDETSSGWLGPFASGETICASHAWQEEGTYTIIVILKDEYGSTIERTHIIMIEDKAPYAKISRPKRAIYIHNTKILPFLVPVIMGDIQLWFGASDSESGLNCLELYIDNELKETFTSIPKSWTWSEHVFFRHTIKIIAYDNAGNTATKIKNVWKFS
jgi:hypothetical protein